MSTRWLYLAIALGFSTGLVACSSSQKAEGDAAGVEDIPLADAATDAVPSAENAPPPADGELPIDGEAPPADQPLPPPTADNTNPPPAPVEAPPAEATPPPPTETAEATPPPAPMDSGSGDYTVQSGDTLMKIAFENYGDLYAWHKIYEANKDKISDYNHVPPGTVLKLVDKPAGVSIDKNGEAYLIRRGDTLGKISRNVYGTRKKWRKIYENNRQLIKDPNKIFAGFTLYYMPDGSGPSTHQSPMAESSPNSGDSTTGSLDSTSTMPTPDLGSTAAAPPVPPAPPAPAAADPMSSPAPRTPAATTNAPAETPPKS